MSNIEITPGDYVCVKGVSPEFLGHRYRAHRVVIDVPAYQRKVLVEGLTGPDRGEWYTCTPANFRVRFQPVPPEPPSNGSPEPEPGTGGGGMTSVSHASKGEEF